jgi:hypothetical protein
MFQKAAKSGCTSTVVSCDLFSPTPSTSSAMKTPEKAEEDPLALNQQLKEIFRWNTPVISCTVVVMNNYLEELNISICTVQ